MECLSLSVDMFLSAVSVLVVAQSNSEIPEGLMNNPVLSRPNERASASHKTERSAEQRLGASDVIRRYVNATYIQF